MTPRTGLAAEVPTLELCREMAAVPALAEAFEDCVFSREVIGVNVWGIGLTAEIKADRASGLTHNKGIRSPLPCEMLAWLKAKRIPQSNWMLWTNPVDDIDYDITDPDSLARALIEAAK